MSRENWVSIAIKLTKEQMNKIYEDREELDSFTYKHYYHDVILGMEECFELIDDYFLFVKIGNSFEEYTVSDFLPKFGTAKELAQEYCHRYGLKGEMLLCGVEIIEAEGFIERTAIGLICVLPDEMDQINQALLDQLESLNEIDFEEYIKQWQVRYKDIFPNLNIDIEEDRGFHSDINIDVRFDVDLIGTIEDFYLYHGTMWDFRKSELFTNDEAEDLSVMGIFCAVEKGFKITEFITLVKSMEEILGNLLKTYPNLERTLYPELWIYKPEEFDENFP